MAKAMCGALKPTEFLAGPEKAITAPWMACGHLPPPLTIIFWKPSVYLP